VSVERADVLLASVDVGEVILANLMASPPCSSVAVLLDAYDALVISAARSVCGGSQSLIPQLLVCSTMSETSWISSLMPVRLFQPSALRSGAFNPRPQCIGDC
jgi:hypothetical protein